MTLTSTIGEIFIQATGNLLSNVVLIATIIWGILIISKKIGDGAEKIIKNVPSWLDDYEKRRMKIITVERAAQMGRHL